MPTVKVKGKKRVFPYNAVGKAQADSFAKMNNGKISYNPDYGMEKKTTSGYQRKMILDQLMLIAMTALLLSLVALADYIEELRKQKKNGKKSR